MQLPVVPGFPESVVDLLSQPTRHRNYYAMLWTKPHEHVAEAELVINAFCDHFGLPRCNVALKQGKRDPAYDHASRTINVPFNVHVTRVITHFCCYKRACDDQPCSKQPLHGLPADHSIVCKAFSDALWGSLKQPGPLWAAVKKRRTPCAKKSWWPNRSKAKLAPPALFDLADPPPPIVADGHGTLPDDNSPALALPLLPPNVPALIPLRPDEAHFAPLQPPTLIPCHPSEAPSDSPTAGLPVEPLNLDLHGLQFDDGLLAPQ